LVPCRSAGVKTPGLHCVGGVEGLALQVGAGGSRSWLLRLTVDGKRRAMGLGSFADVSLARAREKAREARVLVDTPALCRHARTTLPTWNVTCARPSAR
jgi:hypothetical protein